MFMFRGQRVDAALVIHGREVNPYDAVEEVCIGSAFPMKDADRIDFITENLLVLEYLCLKVHNEHLKLVGEREAEAAAVKAPTHTAPPTLH